MRYVNHLHDRLTHLSFALLLCLAVLGCEARTKQQVSDTSAGSAQSLKREQPPAPRAAAPSVEHASIAPSDGHSSWPIFRGDPQSTGVARSTLPDNPELLWKHTVKDGMFEGTPAIADGVAYVGGLDGYFYALDLATGDERWKYYSELGFRAPAAVRDGLVYIGDAEGRFVCLDAAGGKPQWGISTEAEINGGANFYLLPGKDGVPDKQCVLIGSQNDTLYCIDARTGDVQWTYKTGDMIQCSPTIIENRVFIAGCDSVLHIVDADTGEGVAKVEIDQPTGVTPAAIGDRLYLATQGSQVLCIDWRTAKTIWTYEHDKHKNPYQSSPAVSQGILVIGGRDRMVHGLKADSGHELWTFPTRRTIDGSPVIVGERAYVGGGDGRIYGLNLTTGEKLWEYEAGGDFVGSPAVAEGRLVIANGNGDVLCFGTKP